MPKSATADELFEKGLHLLGEGNTLAALSCIEKAFTQKKSARIYSYYAYCIAIERGQITEALKFCAMALSEEPENPEHYLNLGRVYLRAQRKDEAIETFRRGLSVGDNQEIRTLFERIGIRKKPVFPFLPRSNILNKYTGLLLRRLRLR